MEECYIWKSCSLKSCNSTKSNTPAWVFDIFKLYKWYQIAQNITNVFTVFFIKACISLFDNFALYISFFMLLIDAYPNPLSIFLICITFLSCGRWLFKNKTFAVGLSSLKLAQCQYNNAPLLINLSLLLYLKS